MKKLLTLAGVLGGLALPSLAQQTYNQYDRNQDGQVTFAELRTSGVRVDNSIRNLDRNRDKILSRYELRNVQWGNNTTINSKITIKATPPMATDITGPIWIPTTTASWRPTN